VNSLLEQLLSVVGDVSARALLGGVCKGYRPTLEGLGRDLAEKMDATLLPPALEPVPPPVPRLSYCCTLHVGSDGRAVFWCLWSPAAGWHVQTPKGWARTGALPPPRYDPVCHCFADAKGVEPALQPVC